MAVNIIANSEYCTDIQPILFALPNFTANNPKSGLRLIPNTLATANVILIFAPFRVLASTFLCINK